MSPRDQLRRNCGLKQYYVEVHLQDMMMFDEDLASLLITKPNEYVPIVSIFTIIIILMILSQCKKFEEALAEVMSQMQVFVKEDTKILSPSIQLTLSSSATPIAIRQIDVSALYGESMYMYYSYLM
jgi:hypothetical protein